MSHYFFRFRLQPSLSDSSQPGRAVSAEASRRLHLEVSSWDASSKETWRLGEFSKVPVARASGHHPLGALGSMVGEGNGTPLQYSCLENPMDRGAWWAAVHGVAKSWTRLRDFTFMRWRRKWQPTPVFLPGESQGRGSLVGCRLWGRTESDTTEAT